MSKHAHSRPKHISPCEKAVQMSPLALQLRLFSIIDLFSQCDTYQSPSFSAISHHTGNDTCNGFRADSFKSKRTHIEALRSNINRIRFGLKQERYEFFKRYSLREDLLDLRPSELWFLHSSTLVNGTLTSQPLC